MALTLAQQAMLQNNGNLLQRCGVAVYNYTSPIYQGLSTPAGITAERLPLLKGIAKYIADNRQSFAGRCANEIIRVVATQQKAAEAASGTPVNFSDATVGGMTDTSTLVPDILLEQAVAGFFVVVANDPTFVPSGSSLR